MLNWLIKKAILTRKDEVGEGKWEMVNFLVENRTNERVHCSIHRKEVFVKHKMGERRGKVVHSPIKETANGEVGEMGRKVVNRLVKFPTKY